MAPFFRMLLVAMALLTSGALQLAAAMGDDACCATEKGAPCPDCPAGVVCACCPIRGAVQVAVLEFAPATLPGVAIAVATTEPSLGAPVTNIFHPPRA
jgi:hypothetical protein